MEMKQVNIDTAVGLKEYKEQYHISVKLNYDNGSSLAGLLFLSKEKIILSVGLRFPIFLF
jgi:hypothetical protein